MNDCCLNERGSYMWEIDIISNLEHTSSIIIFWVCRVILQKRKNYYSIFYEHITLKSSISDCSSYTKVNCGIRLIYQWMITMIHHEKMIFEEFMNTKFTLQRSHAWIGLSPLLRFCPTIFSGNINFPSSMCVLNHHNSNIYRID